MTASVYSHARGKGDLLRVVCWTESFRPTLHTPRSAITAVTAVAGLSVKFSRFRSSRFVLFRREREHVLYK